MASIHKPAFCVGQRVAYGTTYLRSICDYSHEAASLRGTVARIEPGWLGSDLVYVRWDGHQDERPILGSNLCHGHRVAIDATLA